MLDPLFMLASVGFTVWIARNAIFWSGVFEKNDYSLRRVKQFLFNSSSGRKMLFSPVSLLKWSIIIFYPLIIFHETYTDIYHGIISIIYGLELIIVLKEIIQHRSYLQRKISPKSFSVVIFVIFLAVILYLFPPLDRFLWLVLIDRIIIFLIALWIILLALPEELLWEYIAVKANKKIRTHKKLRSILLIGGEETNVLKYLLFYVLSEKYSVLKTGKKPRRNTIIQTILIRLSETHDFFITDIADASIETVERVHDLISPRFSVLNTLKDVLLRKDSDRDTVSSFRKKMTKGGIVFANKDDLILARALNVKKKNIRFYSSRISNLEWSLSRLEIEKHKTILTIRRNDDFIKIESSLVTALSSAYIMPVVRVLSEIGIPAEIIKTKLASAKLPGGFLEYIQRNDVVFVNNTSDIYHTNISILSSYVSLFSKKKILVLDTEVFSQSADNESIITTSKEFSKDYNYIFLIGTSAVREIKKGVRKGTKNCHVTHAAAEKIAMYILDLIQSDDLVIFHGQEARYCYELVMKGLRREHPDGL